MSVSDWMIIAAIALIVVAVLARAAIYWWLRRPTEQEPMPPESEWPLRWDYSTWRGFESELPYSWKVVREMPLTCGDETIAQLKAGRPAVNTIAEGRTHAFAECKEAITATVLGCQEQARFDRLQRQLFKDPPRDPSYNLGRVDIRKDIS